MRRRSHSHVSRPRRYNQHEIAKVLIEHGARLDAQVPDTGNTALYHAVGSGYAKFVGVLLAARAGLDVRNRGGVTALVYACHIGRSGLAETLLRHGADPYVATEEGLTCLHAAAERGDVRLAALFSDIRPDFPVDTRAADGRTALHVASGHYSAPMIEWLVARGAVVDDPLPETGLTPLMLAARTGHRNTVAALLDAGADVEAKGGVRAYGARALHLAAQNGRIDAIRTLLERGANINARLSLGPSPLFLAAEGGEHPPPPRGACVRRPRRRVHCSGGRAAETEGRGGIP